MNKLKAKISDHLPLERRAQARKNDGTLSSPEPLSHYRDVPAWVLIADPGAGKTDAFKTLSESEGGFYTTARDFVELSSPDDQNPLIFIDGLDEMTAGNTPGSTALGKIRSRLQQLGTPKFRISCREADWRGNTDSAALQRLVGDDNFLELHLAPLTREQTRSLISHWQSSNDEDAEGFMHEAERRDLEGLLDNPQTLRMLVTAVATKEDGWPVSKLQAYELACAQLVREHNDEHLANTSHDTLADDQVILAAGYLSAVMLLSGSGAIALQRHREARAGVMPLPELISAASAPDLTACRTALHTRLFRGNGHGDFWPVHRTVAEYLGARYVMSRVDAGLPARRVLALMQGEDAGIVPELRGLHAWLAATASGELRRELIERDPLGVVLNGDVRHFSREEKLQVLKALRDEATRYTYFCNQNWVSHPFGALATADMEGDFKALLQSADRSPPHLALIDCVLDALAHGQPMPALAPALEQVVRDKAYWSGLRKDALKILATYARKDADCSTLKQLLADVHGNVVEDLEDELLGTLLKVLYPIHISPVKLWQYFRQPKTDGLLSSYWQFWHDLPKRNASTQDVPALLDALLETGYKLSNQRDRLGSSRIVGELLVSGVTQHGAQIQPQRLYGWLSLGLGSQYYCPLEQQHKAILGQWLSERPGLYKTLFELGLQLLTASSDSGFSKLWRVRKHLYGALEPADAELWYLTLAQACSDDSMRRQLVTDSFQLTLQRSGPDAAIRQIEKWSSKHPLDATWVENFLRCPYPPKELEQENIDFEIQHQKRAIEEHRQKIIFFKKELPAFVDSTAHLGALMEVANAYLNYFHSSNEVTPGARLLELLNNDAEWVQLALTGLRRCLFREDVPSATKIVDSYIDGQLYNLAVPCLAAMELCFAEDPLSALDLPQPILEAMVAFHLSHDLDNTPWFKQLLRQQPGILARVMQQLIGKQISAKKEHANGLYALANDSDYAVVAKQIVPPLITDFPLKASKKQLQNLRLLIVAMLARLDKKPQHRLIGTKLVSTDMDVAQRVYWLTAGVLLAPDLHLERARQFVEKNQIRTNHAFALILELRNKSGLLADLPITTQYFFINLLGTKSNPREPVTGRAYRVTPDIEMSRYVTGLISALASNPDDAATQALIDLQQRQDMKQWSDSLSRALYEQRITRRKARFKPASVQQVCATLANLKPANAADLWALTIDHLTQLIREIRDGNTNDYRQYWASETPKIEDDCRDALLSDLKPRLARVGILAEPEGRYADEKRADIKVTALPHHVPIEIKRESHPDVWKAIREQLIAKYGRDSASDGYGIYLVFWFTGKLKAAPTDGGTKVKTPQELQQRLAATVPDELRHKIAVLVVDCSKPPPPHSTK